ncbi:hypothetical protein A6V39_03535 [Candidatus Mycoplasma haematobovis]|uniref:Uncharacterized protein n=1 Tax=Candidatus Mycoplasma haematobovis TaxID=432608 RepID=A0A1A9QCJ2_9MOLU|nr:hypothetical protein [Candidatus Mycoplasma haematobovis]OAL09958.1 hypothetical protein A6V39_03535 [Candidatus Mycoplasma haematobovis]
MAPTIGDDLRIDGHRTIFDSEKPTFEKWVKLYLLFKKELINNNIVSANHTNDKEGAFVFKHWCANSLKSKSNSLSLKVKRYCTMTLGIYALEKEGVQLIEDMENNGKQRKVWFDTFTKNKDSIISSGLFGDLIGDDQDKSIGRISSWCKRNGREPYIPENYEIAKYLSSWCVTEKKD